MSMTPEYFEHDVAELRDRAERAESLLAECRAFRAATAFHDYEIEMVCHVLDRYASEGFIARVRRALANDAAWWSIETAPEATYVLVAVPNYGINIATMTRDPNILGENGKFWFIRGEHNRCVPTHWMPLPDYPRAAVHAQEGPRDGNDTGTPEVGDVPSVRRDQSGAVEAVLEVPPRSEMTQAVSMVEQFCRDLNAAHNEILKLQGVPPEEFDRYDWPEWSCPANSIRWAERLLKKPLSKTSQRVAASREDQTRHE